MSKTNRDFNILIGQLSLGYKQLCLNEAFRAGVDTIYYNKFKEVWDIILVNLEMGYWLELAKIFEKPNKDFNNTLTIYYLLNLEFKGFIKKIEKIRKLRNKLISHNDLKTLRNFKRFLRKLGLKHSDAVQIYEKTIEVLDKFWGHTDSVKNLRLTFNKEKMYIQSEVKKFIKYSG